MLSADNMEEKNLFDHKLEEGECHRVKAPGEEGSLRRTTVFIFSDGDLPLHTNNVYWLNGGKLDNLILILQKYFNR